MKLLSSISNSVQAILNSTTKVFTKTIPTVGEAAFHTTSMANDTIKTARRAQLIENSKEINEMMEKANLSNDQVQVIEQQLEY